MHAYENLVFHLCQVDGKISTAKKKRSRKLTRGSLLKGTEPYIDYSITKPCFGVSPYSKTDPKGLYNFLGRAAWSYSRKKRTNINQKGIHFSSLEFGWGRGVFK